MIRTKRRQSKYFAPQNDKTHHCCDHPGCHEAGEYRAPKDRNLKEYYWFCLKHVQEYNSQWNYYGNNEQPEEEEEPRRRFRFSSRLKYDFDFDIGGYRIFDDFSSENAPAIRLTSDEKNALKFMNLEIKDLTADTLKKAYKKAVKKFHPDLNSTDPLAEEKFKVISTSYKSLLAKLN